jgi:protein-tyrosine phosphatase
MMQRMPELFWVPTPFRGRIAVAERPRGGDWLASDMAAYHAQGVDILVSALADKEIRESWLEAEHEVAAAAGIAFQRLPVPNLLTLTVEEALTPLQTLADAVAAGRGLAAHCYASVGRAPTIVASVLVLLGIEPEDAWDRVRAARGKPVPDTNIQRNWVRQLRDYRRTVSPLIRE